MWNITKIHINVTWIVLEVNSCDLLLFFVFCFFLVWIASKLLFTWNWMRSFQSEWCTNRCSPRILFVYVATLYVFQLIKSVRMCIFCRSVDLKSFKRWLFSTGCFTYVIQEIILKNILDNQNVCHLPGQMDIPDSFHSTNVISLAPE